MLVAVFRARADAERTGARLRAVGHEALIAPVLKIVPVAADLPRGPFDGVIFTSAHGVEAIDPGAVEALRNLPCFCVGERTAEVAAQRGFRELRVGRADAERLASLVSAAFPDPVRLLLVAGRERKPAIERRLTAAGHQMNVAEVYDACAVAHWTEAVRETFTTAPVEAALHYSRRSADLALRLAFEAGAASPFSAMRHHCLSFDAAMPLHQAGFARLTVAPEPSESSLLASL